MSDRLPADREFREKLTLTHSCIVFLVLLFLLVWLAAPVLFLFFGALLFGVFLRAIAGLVHRFTGLSDGLSLAVGTTLFVGVVAGGIALLAPHISSQFSALSEQLPRSIESLKQSFGGSRTMSNSIPSPRPRTR